MTDIMKLHDAAVAAAMEVAVHNLGDRDQKTRAALQSAIEALQAGNERLNDDCAMHMRVAVKAIDEVVKVKAERDALQAKLDATHAVLDSDDSKIVRNAADGYPEGREPRELTLSERVEALCTYATDWKRWCEEVQAKLDELQRQEPVAWTLTEELTKRETTTKAHIWFTDPVNCMWSPLFAAPKELEPVKFLADATRFKTTMLANGRVLINDLPRELAGRWVAFVAAENDCHLKLAAPKALEPLTDERKYKLLDHGEEIQKGDTVLDDDATTWHPLAGWEVGMKWGCNLMPMRRAIEAAHGITKGTPT